MMGSRKPAERRATYRTSLSVKRSSAGISGLSGKSIGTSGEFDTISLRSQQEYVAVTLCTVIFSWVPIYVL
jgi:hypothetical protein